MNQTRGRESRRFWDMLTLHYQLQFYLHVCEQTGSGFMKNLQYRSLEEYVPATGQWDHVPMETMGLGGPDGAQVGGGVIQLTMSELEKKPTTDVIQFKE